jgi:hypothetical protein
MFLKNLSFYHLGLIWSIGTFQENRFIFRHKDRYFLEQIQQYVNNSIYKQQSRTGDQYVLKTKDFYMNQLIEYGWTERNADERNVPILPDYKDFLRAYMELHSTLSYQTSYDKRNGNKKYYRLRIRIFGNKILLESINKILTDTIHISLKTLQKTNNDKTFYTQYTSLTDIKKIFNYITGEPHNKMFWDNVDIHVQNPRKYL